MLSVFRDFFSQHGQSWILIGTEDKSLGRNFCSADVSKINEEEKVMCRGIKLDWIVVI